jgi:ABC-type phosphate transport system substrate-binding protein
MELALQKHRGSGRRAALLGLSVLGCCLLLNLTLADVSSAAVPAGGSKDCQTDGKISGRGSTYQKLLQQAYAQAYRDDFCGEVGTASSEEGEAGNTMIAYDYTGAEKNGGTGSGEGLNATGCRSDAFGGTDKPYTTAELKELDSAPGPVPRGGSKPSSCTFSFSPPFAPSAPYPGTTNTTANVMTIPIGGSAVALPINLPAAECGGTAPTEIDLTGEEISKIFGGEVTKWNEAPLTTNNPALKNCTGEIVRIVRQDSSGTTTIFKSYLEGVDPNRTGQTKCNPGKTWTEYFSKNTEWPGKPAEGTCAGEIKNPAGKGGPELLALVRKTANSIGFLDEPEAVSQTNEALESLIIPSVSPATGTTPQQPNAGFAANCNYSVGSLPGLTSGAAVGLEESDTWATDNKTVNGEPWHGNVTDLGSKYPICGLTFDLVYTGLSDTAGTGNAITGLTADQRRTLYSYFTFILSSTAQRKLSSIYYAPLPTAWLGTLSEGFQANF